MTVRMSTCNKTSAICAGINASCKEYKYQTVATKGTNRGCAAYENGFTNFLTTLFYKATQIAQRLR